MDLLQSMPCDQTSREVFTVARKDFDLLLRQLFEDDGHDYIHERTRFQDAFSLFVL